MTYSIIDSMNGKPRTGTQKPGVWINRRANIPHPIRRGVFIDEGWATPYRWLSSKPEQSPWPKIRWKKVCVTRQQLLKGEYDLARRLNVTIERVLQDLTP